MVNIKRKFGKYKFLMLSLLLASTTLNAAWSSPVCQAITDIYTPFASVGGALVLLMFVYGAVTYVYGADNPGTRKKARDIMVHSLIGGVIIIASVPLASLAGGALC